MVLEVLKNENIKFNRTLEKGLREFDKLLNHLNGDIIDKDNAFKLYDTYGFPIELTEEMAINSAIEEEILHKFRTIITQLSPQQQEIMKMSMDGMKVKEIAKVLNVSENAIKMQKKRAYSVIREELGECWSVLLIMRFPNLKIYE